MHELNQELPGICLKFSNRVNVLNLRDSGHRTKTIHMSSLAEVPTIAICMNRLVGLCRRLPIRLYQTAMQRISVYRHLRGVISHCIVIVTCSFQ